MKQNSNNLFFSIINDKTNRFVVATLKGVDPLKKIIIHLFWEYARFIFAPDWLTKCSGRCCTFRSENVACGVRQGSMLGLLLLKKKRNNEIITQYLTGANVV
jgi:hypothetical protein